MQFTNFSDFIAMGGHGFYVWLSYGISFSLLVLLTASSIHNNTKIIKKISMRQKREKKLKQAAKTMHLEANTMQEND